MDEGYPDRTDQGAEDDEGGGGALRAERHPRVIPAATTMVRASTISTALAAEDGEEQDDGRRGRAGRRCDEVAHREARIRGGGAGQVVRAATAGARRRRSDGPQGCGRVRQGPSVRGRLGRRPCAPTDLDEFLSFVDPAHRESVAAFGDLSSVAIPMFGGVDPGMIDDADAVRAVATRRLAGMGVDTEAAADWLANYSSDWVFAADADGRRLAVLEDQGIHAEVAFPGPVLTGGLSPAMYLGGQTSKGLEPVWPAIHAYNRWLAEFCAAAPGRRAACIPIDLHDMDRAVEEIAWVRSLGRLRRGDAPGHVDQVRTARLRRRVLRAALERLRGPRHGGQPAHRGLGHRHRQQVPLRRQARWLSSGCTRCSCSPGARSGS